MAVERKRRKRKKPTQCDIEMLQFTCFLLLSFLFLNHCSHCFVNGLLHHLPFACTYYLRVPIISQPSIIRSCNCSAVFVLTTGFGHLGGHIGLVGMAGYQVMPATPTPPFVEYTYSALVLCLLPISRTSRSATLTSWQQSAFIGTTFPIMENYRLRVRTGNGRVPNVIWPCVHTTNSKADEPKGWSLNDHSEIRLQTAVNTNMVIAYFIREFCCRRYELQ